MAQKLAQFLNRGMMRDISISKASNEFAFENFNIRLTPMDKETLLTVTNERGNAAVPDITINGYILGYCVLNRNLVIFATDPTAASPDSIYKVTFDVDSADSDYIECYRRIDIGPHQTRKQRVTALSFYADGGTAHFSVESGRKWAVGTVPPPEEEEDPVWSIETLYNGNLNFRVQNPIETLGVYEAEAIQKVYWLDGLNQPRIINIAKENPQYDDYSFDFLPTLKLTESVSVEKVFGYSGLFPSGVIQYALTYSRDYGQESAIFYSTPLLYLTDQHRGLSAESTTSCAFRINVSNLDSSFDKLNIYSIIRTSENGVPVTKLVTQVNIKNVSNTSFLDLNTTGEVVDPTSLLYKGGEWISSYTMSHKDNTLFLGNIKLLRNPVESSLREMINSDTVTITEETTLVTTSPITGYFSYSFNLNNIPVSYMKRGEWYRLGLQFQDSHGKWTDPIYVGDRKMQTYPQNNGNGEMRIPRIRMTISELVYNAALGAGYLKLRPVVVYPSYAEQICLVQGVVNPTVFTLDGRYNNAPFAQASWFFRPMRKTEGEIDPNPRVIGGRQMPIEWRGLHMISSAGSIFGEYQLQENVRNTGGQVWYNERGWANLVEGEGLLPSSTEDNYYTGIKGNTDFAVDSTILTLNSPDIDLLANDSYNNLKFRIVGAISLLGAKMWGTASVETETPPAGGAGYGFANPDYGAFEYLNNTYPLHSWMAYFDKVPNALANGTIPDGDGFAFPIYPWQRSGSLNNDIPGAGRSAVLKTKKMSNITYISDLCHYFFSNPWEAEDEIGSSISQVNIVNNQEKYPSIIPLPEGIHFDNKYQNIVYYGNEDTLLYPTHNTSPNYIHGTFGQRGGGSTPTVRYVAPTDIVGLKQLNYGLYGDLTGRTIDYAAPRSASESDPDFYKSTDPVRMRYKSTPHAVFSLGSDSDGKLYASPVPNSDFYDKYWGNYHTRGSTLEGYPFFMRQNQSLSYDMHDYFSVPIYTPSELPSDVESLLWIGELYKEVDEGGIFGGTSDYAIENNTWLPCGDPTPLSTMQTVSNEGDTFYQRWDCLKTYAFGDSDQNSVVEILSFYVESHHNLDGRWDRNRRQLDNTYMSPTNFNLFNPVYDQENNFFSYHILPDIFYENTVYPNQITWTGTKSYGETIDSWTTVNLAAVLDMDGDKGPVEAIRRWNNNLIAFQDRGIAEIMYNSRTSLTTAEGTPIEVASSGKVEGKSYINDKVGCSNKWSIIEGKQGIYFIDDLNASINVFTDNVRSLSDEKGFKVWAKENQSIKVWDPYYFGNFRTYYDTIRGDVYFVNKDTCLCFSETLGEFVSFYSYEDIPLMANVLNRLVTFKDTKLWVQNEGQYNVFYGVHQPYYVQHRITPSPYSDKIFNTVEYRADMFNANDELTNHTFDVLEVDNEYQHGISLLHFDKAKVSNLKRKFRIWRANIPRDTKDDSRGMNRIRNPWINLKLTKDTPGDTERMEFHDLLVRYFE